MESSEGAGEFSEATPLWEGPKKSHAQGLGTGRTLRHRAGCVQRCQAVPLAVQSRFSSARPSITISTETGVHPMRSATIDIEIHRPLSSDDRLRCPP